jgi:Ubiquitin family
MWCICESAAVLLGHNSVVTVKLILLAFLCYQLKAEVATKFETAVATVCLIYAGKILKDDETLVQHGIKDGVTVHLVIRQSTSQVLY